MKLELPLAVIVLAGCWWFSQASRWSEGGGNARGSANQPVATKPLARSDNDGIFSPEILTPQPGLPSLNLDELWGAVLTDLRDSPPLQARYQLRLNLFQADTQWQADYVQAGRGTPQCRWEFVTQIQREGEGTPVTARVVQIFDGRFYYFHEALPGSEARLQFVDLSPVAKLPPPKIESVPGLRGWFGTGGWVPWLEQFSANCEFRLLDYRPATTPTSTTTSTATTASPLPNATNTTWITVHGQWRQDSLRQLLRDQVKREWLEPEVQWSRLPRQLPQHIVLKLGVDSQGHYFIHELAYYRQSERGSNLQRVLHLQLQDLAILETAPREWFQVVGDGLAAEDLSSDYLYRIKQFLYQAVQ